MIDTSPLIFVMYDSISNAVFEGQIRNLLHKKSLENPYRPIHLVTFEKNKPTHIPSFNYMHVTCLKRLPFIGFFSIAYAAFQLRSFLSLFPHYTLIARGPIAHIIAQRSIDQKSCKNYIQQVRGLLSHEYAYVHTDENQSFVRRLWHTIRTKQLQSIERRAYTNYNAISMTIEVVSNALKQYLIDTYGTQKESIYIATDDIPTQIEPYIRHKWKIESRKKLHIPDNWTVYCYNGSAHKWQKPNEIISFFKEKLAAQQEIFLLILSTDKIIFQNIINQGIPEEHYTILHIKHNDVYQYLCAADYGLLFREEHIINWVSRPTKALEYQAVNLPIIHNNTVAFLCDKESV